MTPDKSQVSSAMTTRQKITIAAFAIIILVILWQIYSLLRGSSPSPTTMPGAAKGNPSAMNTNMPMKPAAPQPAQLMKPQPAMMSQEEANMLRMQQQAESQYLSAINQLQMLKIERDIAETNKAIMTAKLDTVTAEKGIVDLLQPPAPPPTQATYARGLLNPGIPTTPQNIVNQPPPPVSEVNVQRATVTPEVNYTVISVSRLQSQWAAVLGYQGNLFNVKVGDILPADGSVVVSVGNSGVLLERKGIRRKISLVPII